ncbi:hypothetical protein SAMN02745216_00834 [Desulfatibacillum alkenivorans DSM 16219]|uniref:Uncharacterized protein n=1 Tax=Desulfatibacillum alkenivorans DSM 16219 TaxID=1121393 RepID=A0A1M6FJ17_9BACT|nr:hypothetical protein [Desulfatibacillum alkenivorans]SHI97653.1 hypothetical protein SAMN02745216_00834 [Desulfatibacillum alkenivorans DSM 16219]
MTQDKSHKSSPPTGGTCTVSAKSRVREPGENSNGAVTLSGYEMEVLRSRERALDAQKIAEDATRKAGAAQGRKIVQSVRLKKGAAREVVYLANTVEEASAEIRESARQARLCMLEAMESASVEFSRLLDREVRRSLENAREALSRMVEERVRDAAKKEEE